MAESVTLQVLSHDFGKHGVLRLTRYGGLPRFRSPQSHRGPVVEWLGSGLQIRVRRFNSGPGLHSLPRGSASKRKNYAATGIGRESSVARS